MGEEAFDAAYRQGRRLTLDAAVDLALEAVGQGGNPAAARAPASCDWAVRGQ